MEVSAVLKHEGTRVIVTLKNNYSFTLVIPPHEEWDGEATFTTTDKKNELITIDCDYIAAISAISNKYRSQHHD